MNELVDTYRRRLGDPAYARRCRTALDASGALVLDGFFRPDAIARAVAESVHREAEAYYAASSHNAYLTPPDPTLPSSHPFNRQIVSSKGLIADSRKAYLKIISIEPDHEKARMALGHALFEGKWVDAKRVAKLTGKGYKLDGDRQPYRLGHRSRR